MPSRTGETERFSKTFRAASAFSAPPQLNDRIPADRDAAARVSSLAKRAGNCPASGQSDRLMQVGDGLLVQAELG